MNKNVGHLWGEIWHGFALSVIGTPDGYQAVIIEPWETIGREGRTVYATQDEAKTRCFGMVRIACEVLAGLAASRMDHITKIGDGGDRAQPSRGTERKSIPDAAGAAKYTPVSPVADECASPPDPTIRKDQQ